MDAELMASQSGDDVITLIRARALARSLWLGRLVRCVDNTAPLSPFPYGRSPSLLLVSLGPYLDPEVLSLGIPHSEGFLLAFGVEQVGSRPFHRVRLH